MFLTLMVIGMVGLVMMALPALGHRGHLHAPPPHGHALIRAAGARPALAKSVSHGGLPADVMTSRLVRWVPSPRWIFTVLALYGAFGNALVHGAHLRPAVAALAAIAPAWLIERLVVRPVWNLLFRFQGSPSSPFGDLLMAEARAVVPFRNGRGIVSVVRDGRVVQLSATLADDQGSIAVPVGARMRVEAVDEARERVTVSLIAP